MSSAPFMPLYVGDYLGDTKHLTIEQHGAYLLLLMAMWRAGGRLPNEAAKLSRIVGVTPSRWAKLEADVLEFFQVDDGALVHARLARELEKASDKSAKRSAAGKRGAEAKSRKTLNTPPANADRLLKQSPPPAATPAGLFAEPAEFDLAPFAESLQEAVRQAAVQWAFDAWNETAELCGLPIAEDLTDTRRRNIKARLKDKGPAGWRRALDAVEMSRFCRGLEAPREGKKKPFRADLDFVLQAKSFQRLLEGFYGADAPPPKPSQPVEQDPNADWRYRMTELTRNRFWNETDWGPRPRREGHQDQGCFVPPEVLDAFGFPSQRQPRSAA